MISKEIVIKEVTFDLLPQSYMHTFANCFSAVSDFKITVLASESPFFYLFKTFTSLKGTLHCNNNLGSIVSLDPPKQ